MESKLPLSAQQYSDLYKAYIHSFDDMFSSCSIAQKEFFDKLNIPQSALKEFDMYLDYLGKSYQNWIDLCSKHEQTCVQAELSMIKSYDQFFHLAMTSYAQSWSKLNQIYHCTPGKLVK